MHLLLNEGTRQFVNGIPTALCPYMSRVSYLITDFLRLSLRILNCLRSLERWDRGFESLSRHGCLYCVRLYCVCFVLCVETLRRADSPSKESWKSGQGPIKGCRAIIIIKVRLFIHYLFKDAASSSDYITSSGRMVNVSIGKDVEESGRSLIWGAIMALAGREWGKQRKTSVGIAGFRAKIWIKGLQNTKTNRTVTLGVNLFKISSSCRELNVSFHHSTNAMKANETDNVHLTVVLPIRKLLL
jgi:hypothetical protein